MIMKILVSCSPTLSQTEHSLLHPCFIWLHSYGQFICLTWRSTPSSSVSCTFATHIGLTAPKEAAVLRCFPTQFTLSFVWGCAHRTDMTSSFPYQLFLIFPLPQPSPTGHTCFTKLPGRTMQTHLMKYTHTSPTVLLWAYKFMFFTIR